MFVDSHAHLDFKDLKNNFTKIVDNSIKNKISSILTICTKINEFPKILNNKAQAKHANKVTKNAFKE